MKLKGMSISAFVCALVSPLIVAASETGTIQLVDESGISVLTYSSGEAIHVEVSDPDLNINLSIVESVQVLVTSETENSGSKASHTIPLADKNNVGDGSLRVKGTGYDTLTEDWTVTAVNSYSFIVTGSESGLQSQQYDIYANDNGYVTDNSEVRFKIDTGSVGFNTGDSFTFSTIAGTIVGEAVTLTETDVDSGVFTGSIDVNEAATSIEGDGLLDIQTGDLITAVYTDAAGDWGDEEQVRTTALYAATILPGSTLLKDTVWTKENSPYLITGDITVSSGTTLTVMAGVEVLFLANSDDTSDGQNPYNSELWINGSLVVAGNDDDKVVFTSSNRNGEVGDWGGIRINNGSASIAHMLMEYSDYGIATQDMYDNAVFSITHSELTNNRQAISVYSLYNNGTATVSNNHIHDNAGYALQANYGSAEWSINNNTIENNGSAIYLYDLKGVTLDGNTITGNQNRGVYLDSIEGDVIITDNVITDNQDGGIYGYSYSYGNNTSDYTATITGNTVSDNNSNGIELTLSKHNHIDVSDNEVDGNSGSGIRLYSESNSTKATVHNNTITNNGQDSYYGGSVGLYISGNVVPSIVGNVIDGNGAGVYVSYAESGGSNSAEISGNHITNNDDYGISVHNYANPVINGNDIYGNGGYALENHTSNAINAKNNWWGEDDTAEMNEGDNPKALSFIYDGSENSATGGVNYSGWLNGSITTGGEPTSQTSTGELHLVDSDGNVAQTYESGATVYLNLADIDGNISTSDVDTITVLVTSETEDTGEKASHTLAIAGKNNVGDGSLRVTGTGYDTLTEDWTVTAVNSYSFIVTGSESGLQSQQYDIYANDNGYVTDNSEVRFKIDTGAVGFNTGDSFTFSTIAGTIVGETVTLTETDVDSGVFTGSIDVNEAATSIEGDGLLDIQTGDLITAVYTDAAGDWGDEEQVRTTALYAATILPGSTLLKDTVWAKENSPYLITGDITVSSGTTLTVMAGVEVLFLANSDDTSDGQNPYNSELWINGSLVVAGNDDDKVVLTSSNRNGEVGDWGGIRINNGSASIAHMLMEYSDYGIATQDMYDNAEFSVTHSELTNNRQAISVYSLYNNGTATVSNNHIHDNTSSALQANYGSAEWSINNNTIENNGSAIYLYDLKGVTLDGNTITGNQNRGVYLDSIEGDVIITDNVITDNQDGGIYGYSYSYGNNTSDYTATITGNTVSDNNSSGIELTLSKHNHIDVSDNEVDGNSGSGIRLYSESNSTKATVHNNIITNNGQDSYYGGSVGLYISGNVVPSIVGNQIEGNGAGVFISYDENNGSETFEISGNHITNNDDYGISVHNYANPVINGNDIYGNGGYALENHTSNAINAKNNWWGEDDTAEMNEGNNPKALSFIYDGSENSATGGVNYSGWLNGSITTGGEPTSQTSTGELYLVDSDGNVAQTYESGETINVSLADIDGNISMSDVDTITVLVTSETEDTGEKASHTLAIAGKNNVGDGSLRVKGTGYDTLTEDWTVTAVNSYSFIVTGSESGLQSQQYDIYANDNGYVTDNSEVRFKIDTGSVGFNTGDSFTFSTIAGTIVGEAVTLTETDVDSGVFTGSIDVNEAATSIEGDGLLDIQTGDLITAVYTDAAGDWGDEEQVRTTALYAATILPGSTLLKDTVWTKENSPYLITGDITVSSGTTLTVMAGVEVLFLANSDDTSDGQNPYNSELWINGSLVVAGNDDDKVVFTSSNRNGEVGDWGGIRINNGSASIAHMLMEYSDYGIATQDMYDNAVFSITHSELTNNRQAISVYSLYNNGTATVSNNHIHDNAGYALQANYGSAEWSINNNTIENNGSAIYLYDLKGVTLDGNTITGNQNRGVYLDSIEGDVIITDNVITDNQDGGIYGYSYSYGNNTSDYTATITGNTVSDNNSSGIELTLSKHNHIDVSDNEVDGNSGSGIRLYSESNSTKATVHNNIITNNGQDSYYGGSVGLYISGNVVPSIVGNQIEGNGAGVFISYDENNGSETFEISGNHITNNDDYGISVHNYANPVINGNDIYGNGGYALENHTSNAINAKNNWWGEDDTAEMNEGNNPKALSFIYDGYTDSSVGKVNYSNWASSPVLAKHVRHDTNGDGKADILWRNTNDGRNWMWTMDGMSANKSAGINVIADQAWTIAGRGDFNGDGKSDILWRNQETGRNYIYLMDGFTIKQRGELNYVYDTKWKIKEVMDLNGDGKDDIIWRHEGRGDTWIYLMDGIKPSVSKASLKVADLNWQIVGSGDVNGDGFDDVIWRHQTKGTNYIWLMEGANITSRYTLNNVNTNWDIVGAGDINGDGTADIIWRNQTDGRNWAYLMEDGEIKTSSLINTVSNTNWSIADIADLNGDGKADFFWRQQQSGQTYMYMMGGVKITEQGYGATVGTSWQVIH